MPQRMMRRREFLHRSAAAAAVLAVPVLGAAQRPGVSPGRAVGRRDGAPKQVIVIGAGLAGLSAAYELVAAGHEVTILEAQRRAGGRVLTLRDPFPEGLHVEAGAGRIPAHHDLALGYIARFGLPLEPFQPAGSSTVYVANGRRMVVRPGDPVDWPFPLTPVERALGLAGIRQKYVGALLESLGDVTDRSWPPPSLARYDGMNRSELWRERGASDGAMQLLAWGGFDDHIDTVSALFTLRSAALGGGAGVVQKIRGGNDLLPAAFASRLAGRIRYGSPVFRIEHDTRGATAFYRRNGGVEQLTGDHLVCAVPFTVQRDIEVSPPFSVRKQEAIEQLPYKSVSKVFLQTRTRYWRDAGLDGFAITDLPVREVWDSTVGQPGTRGIMQCFPISVHARRLAALSEADRLRFAVDQAELVYPGMRANFEGGVSKCWDDDPWARGASAYYKPGQMTTLLPHVATPEGRVHFAGEHTSVWMDGWMQGALESGARVAREVNAGP